MEERRLLSGERRPKRGRWAVAVVGAICLVGAASSRGQRAAIAALGAPGHGSAGLAAAAAADNVSAVLAAGNASAALSAANASSSALSGADNVSAALPGGGGGNGSSPGRHSFVDDDADDPCHHIKSLDDGVDHYFLETPPPTRAPTTPHPTTGTPFPTLAPSVHNVSVAATSGRCEDDDDAVVTTKNNSALHVLRNHYATHHHHKDLDREGNATWDDDDRGIWDDDTSHDQYVFGLSTYCGNKITKNTQSSANATATFEWYVGYLGAYCQSMEDCDIGCSVCGNAMRAALPGMTLQGTRADYSCFGLHAVDATARPQGAVAFADAVDGFERGLMNFTRVTPFVDQSTIMFAENADKYITKFDHDGVPYLLGQWFSEGGVRLYSVIAHVPHTLGCVEIVTRHVSDARVRSAARPMSHARLPDTAFAIARVNITASSTTSTLLVPLAVSKVTHSMAEVARFYEDILHAAPVAYSEPGKSWGRLYQLWDAEIAVRFVASDDAQVLALENLKKATHAESYASPWCGTDRYYDNHYACTSPTPNARACARARARSRLSAKPPSPRALFDSSRAPSPQTRRRTRSTTCRSARSRAARATRRRAGTARTRRSTCGSRPATWCTSRRARTRPSRRRRWCARSTTRPSSRRSRSARSTRRCRPPCARRATAPTAGCGSLKSMTTAE